MLIEILITILGIFTILTLESFLTTLISFSILIVIVLVFLNRWEWKKWCTIVFLLTFLIDILLHRGMGITLMAVSLSAFLLYILFLLVPKKQVLLSYIPYFFAVLIFYIIVQLFSPVLLDGVWGIFSWNILFSFLLRSFVSTLLIFFAEILIDRFRTDRGISI